MSEFIVNPAEVTTHSKIAVHIHEYGDPTKIAEGAFHPNWFLAQIRRASEEICASSIPVFRIKSQVPDPDM